MAPAQLLVRMVQSGEDWGGSRAVIPGGGSLAECAGGWLMECVVSVSASSGASPLSH